MKVVLLLAVCLGTAARQGVAGAKGETASATDGNAASAVLPGSPSGEAGSDNVPGVNSRVSNFPLDTLDMEPRGDRGDGYYVRRCRDCRGRRACRYVPRRREYYCYRRYGNDDDRPRACYKYSARGSCNGRYRRWYYDYRSGRCRRFTYSGCRGNRNRFRSLRACRRTCRRRGFTDRRWDNRGNVRQWDIDGRGPWIGDNGRPWDIGSRRSFERGNHAPWELDGHGSW